MSRSAIFSAARASGKSFLRSDNAFVNAKKPSLQRNILDLTRRFTTVGVAAKPSTAYPGEPSVFTTDFGFKKTFDTLPTYRIMDEFGKVLDQKQLPQLDKDIVRRMYTSMLQLNAMDGILYNVQRQGRISFYMTHFGEEATHVGSAAALSPEDTIFAQYREAGTLIWRGFTLDEFMNQCYSNEEDYGKGRQMPVHYGSKKINFQTISSPLATQLPQSVGASYAQKLAKSKNCTICYFGEGAASEGDFHAALNFAATLQTPTIFFCRNNRWAISTPSTEQFKGDGIGVRGVAYGIDTIRVDGNDIFAVYNATQQARKMAVEQNRPTVIEAMTYRVSHHSTSDDSTRYRPDKEVDEWKEKFNPILRLKNYMLARNLWTEEEDVAFIKKVKADVLEALKKAEGKKKPHLDELFNDVYDQLPPNLVEQKKELLEHIAKYPEHYPIDQHAS